MKLQHIFLMCSSVFCLIIFSCAGGFYDQKIDLGDGYFFLGKGSHSSTINRLVYVDMTHKTEKIIIYPSVSNFNFNAAYIIVEQIPDSIGYRVQLSEKLKRTAWVFNYVDTTATSELPILIRLDYEIHRMDTAFYQYLNDQISQLSQDEKGQFLDSVADSILHTDPQYENIFSGELKYWIIDKHDKELHGPFDQIEYERKRAELNIPKSLSLESE